MTENTFAASPPNGVWDDLNKSAGARVRQLREAAGLTPSDLMHRFADRGIRLHPTQIGRIEAGDRVLRLDEAHVVTAIFGIEMSALVEGTHDLEVAALELQQQDALSELTIRREMLRRFYPTFLEFQQVIEKVGQEIEYYTSFVHEMEQRIANVKDGETDEDLADANNGYTEDI